MSPQNYRQGRITRALRKAWTYLRQVTGDAAYENYMKYCAANESNSNPPETMTRAEFYNDAQRRKYSTINRCC